MQTRGARAFGTIGAWISGFALLALVGVLVAVGIGSGGSGDRWFSAGVERSGPVERQAAQSTGGNNSTADIGNAIAGTCATRFEFDTIRLRVEVTADSQHGVTVDLPNAGVAGEAVAPGEGRTFALEKGSGHCKFAGPEGTIGLAPGTIAVRTSEGYTRYFGGTSLQGSIAGQAFTLDEGESTTFTSGEVVRPSDPSRRIAELIVRVKNIRLPSGFLAGVR